MIPSYWPAFQYGGPIPIMHGLSKAMVRNGVDVTVYTTNVGIERNVLVNQEVVVDGVKVTYFEFAKSFEFMGTTGWQFSWPMTKALKRNLKDFDFVFIMGVWNYPVAVAAYYCRWYRKQYIISPQGTLYPYTFRKKSWKKWPYYQLITKRDLMGASGIHYTADDEAEKCHSYLGLKNRAVVIPNGIDLSEFNNSPPKENLKEHYSVLKDKKVILFLGRINWKKGLDILIKAYSEIARERNDVHLLIVGNDDGDGYSKKVQKWIEEFGMRYLDYGSSSMGYGVRGKDYRGDVQVTFTGMLTGREKLEALSGSDIFVLPSYSENFGMAVIEAMTCGLPVIISDQVGVYKEIAEAKAGIVIKTDVEQLDRAIRNLLDNLPVFNEMAKNGRCLVENKFTWDKVAEQMIAVYQDILSR